ncbi:MAG: tetratricopeptide repeat protein [Anaerolineae bacterium]
MMRKFIMLILLAVLLVAVPAYAQDSSAQTQPAQQGGGSSLVAGLDIYQRAAAAFDAQDYKKAITDYSLFILLNPTVGEGYFQRAQSYLQLDNLDEALLDLNRTLELPPASDQAESQAHMLRSGIYIQREQLDAALDDLNIAVEKAPDSPDALYRRARLFLVQQQYEPALKDLDAVVQLAPNFPDAYYFRAVANTQLEHIDLAIEDFTQVIKAAPNDVASYIGRADLYIRQEDYASALGDLDQAIQLDSTIGGWYLLRGMVNNKLGNSATAAADYLEWIRGIRKGDINTSVQLRPNESQVLPMQDGLIYAINFAGRAGDIVNLSATARPGSNVDPLLVIGDQDGNVLVANDDSGDAFDAVITDFKIPADGTYTILLTHAGGGSSGAVRLLLEISN